MKNPADRVILEDVKVEQVHFGIHARIRYRERRSVVWIAQRFIQGMFATPDTKPRRDASSTITALFIDAALELGATSSAGKGLIIQLRRMLREKGGDGVS